MFCKFCGNRIEPNDSVCPKCRQVVTAEDGNGFWDMAGEPRRAPRSELEKQATQEKPVVREKSVEREKPVEREKTDTNAVKKTSALPLAVSVLVCFLCLAVLLVGRVSNGRAVRKINSDYEDLLALQKTYEEKLRQFEDQQKIHETQIQQLELRVASLEDEPSQRSEASAPIQVVHAPGDETQAVGFCCKSGSYLFRFQINGPAVSFQWEKQLEDGDWIALDFDDQNVDAKYGLRLEEDTEEGVSKLVAVGLTEESGGTYRCTVTTKSAEETVMVNLALQADDSAG